MKESGIDRVIEKVIHRIGNLKSVYLVGDFARGKDSKVIELILSGESIDKEYLEKKVSQAEELVGRKVSYTVLNSAEANQELGKYKPTEFLVLWNLNEVDLKTK